MGECIHSPLLTFLSTPSARRATSSSALGATALPDFYPRPPRGGRLVVHCECSLDFDFYPRPPRGGRLVLSMSTMHSHLFLSTPSARRATLCGVLGFHGLGISIHALREEGDALSAAMTANPIDFYPRPPRGGRPTALTAARTTVEFLSTPSARRATGVSVGYRIDTIISIHALREEGDASAAGCNR